RIGSAAGHDRGAAARGERDGVVERVAAAEAERQAGRERVAGAVGVDDRARQRRGSIGTAGLHPAAERPGGRDDYGWRRFELAGPVRLALILPAPDEDVELHARFAEGREP